MKIRLKPRDKANLERLIAVTCYVFDTEPKAITKRGRRGCVTDNLTKQIIAALAIELLGLSYRDVARVFYTNYKSIYQAKHTLHRFRSNATRCKDIKQIKDFMKPFISLPERKQSCV